ncbi:hypothetical protein [Haloprofundus salinisoli]|uniref:hypothetical protein n=1 Tax=Haloprofundus salinisoli TaxID=2876193 RepID=UPI001CCC8188|nr:hypothetical protein [Haloprofundus salinisoli]
MDALREFIEGRVPNEWVRAPGKAIAFERNGLRVEAERVATPQRFGRRWEIRCRESVGEVVDQRRVRYVTSKEEALDAVYDWMRRLEGGATADALTDGDVAGTMTHPDVGTVASITNIADAANAGNAANASPRVERG